MGNFIYQLYDIEKLSDYYNVNIYDFSNLVAPSFGKFKDKHKLNNKNLLEINGWIQAYSELIKIIKKNNLVIFMLKLLHRVITFQIKLYNIVYVFYILNVYI